jgi:hypothetical protein
MNPQQEKGTDRPSRPTSGLRTTTWGAVIAFSLVAMAGYFGSHRSTSPLGQGGHSLATTARTAAAPAQSGASGRPADTSRGALSQPVLSASNGQGITRGTRPLQPSFTSSATPQQFAASNRQPVASPDSRSNTGMPAAATQADDAAVQGVLAAKLSPDLKGIDPQAPVDVIVQFHQSPNPSDLAGQGAIAKAELPLIHAALVTVTGANLSNLASQANVAYISPNRQVKGALNHVITAVN